MVIITDSRRLAHNFFKLMLLSYLMKIILRSHLKIRLDQRKIPQNYPRKIFSKPEAKYFDTFTFHLIVILSLSYNNKVRPISIAYDIIEEEIQIITVHPIKKQEISNRLKSGRWIKDEKD